MGRWSARCARPTLPSDASARSAPFPPRHAPVAEGQRDVLDEREAREEVEALEDEADLLTAQAGEVVRTRARGVATVQAVAPGGRLREAAEHLEERRLPAAGGAHDDHHLAAFDPQVDAAQRVDGAAAEVVDLLHLGQLDHGLAVHRRAHCSRTVAPAWRPETIWTRSPSMMPISTACSLGLPSPFGTSTKISSPR